MAANQVTVATPGPAGATGLVYEGLWVVTSIYQVRDLVRYTDNNLYVCNTQHTAASGNNPVADSDIWTLFINADDAFQWATKAKHTIINDSVSNPAGYSALHNALKAADWAKLINAAVTDDPGTSAVDYSSKAWSIGSTGVTSTSGKGASKDWAIGSGGVMATRPDGAEYSSKEYATGTTAPLGSAKSWASKDTSAVASSLFSAKEYASGVAATGGTSKEWAQKVDGAVDSTFSAKEYAQGTTAGTGGSALNWASQTGADITGGSSGDKSAKSWASEEGANAPTDGSAKQWAQLAITPSGTATDASAKEWATGVSTHKNEGSAKEWATYTGAIVRGASSGSWSAKEWAVGTTASTGGSAKDYATYVGGGVRGETGDHSSKAWSIGGTGVTTTNLKGAAKEWATTTGGAVDTADFSSKAWAIGGTGVTTTSGKGAAKQWAVADNLVDTADFSSKAWATGGTGVTTTSGKGAAKEWSIATGLVDTASYSSKSYAQSTTSGTDTYAGSAKGWASTAYNTQIPGAASSDRSSLHYSTLASNSALAAKASAAAVASTFDSFDDTYLGTMPDTQSSATDADTTGTWAINSSVITVASATNIIVGQEVTGSGIPTDANVIAVSGVTITISENMAAAGSGVDLDFRGQGVYGVFNVTKDGPATDNDGGALANGMLYFNTTDNSMKVYKETGAAWIKTSASGGVSLVMHKAVASGTPTSFAATDFTPTLSYEVNNIVVWLNGVKLDATDYTATTGTTITGLSALANLDEMVVLAFKTFEVGDAVSAASGGTFGGAVTFGAGFTVTDESTDTSCYPLFVTAATGSVPPKTGTNLTFNSNTGVLTATGFAGPITGAVTGNASTATALATARTIGGTSFDGTGNIAVALSATATALATGRTIGMTGDVVWTSPSFDGSGNVTAAATIQANSVTMGTDTTGNYVATVTAGTGLTSTGATSGESIAHSLSVDPAQTQITSVGTLTSFRSTGIDDNADALAITIDSSERVGIGIAVPAADLHISESGAAEVRLQMTNSATANQGSTGGTALIMAADGTNSYLANYESTGVINFYVNGAVRQTIDSSGDVIILAGGDLETSTTGKVKQKGAFMENSVHQSWVMGG